MLALAIGENTTIPMAISRRAHHPRLSPEFGRQFVIPQSSRRAHGVEAERNRVLALCIWLLMADNLLKFARAETTKFVLFQLNRFLSNSLYRVCETNLRPRSNGEHLNSLILCVGQQQACMIHELFLFFFTSWAYAA